MIAKIYQTEKLHERPFAITGYYCIQRGITIMSNNFHLTHAVLSYVSDKAEAYQVAGRCCGTFRNFKGGIKIYTTSSMWNKMIPNESGATNFAKVSNKENGSIEKKTDKDWKVEKRKYENEPDIPKKRKRQHSGESVFWTLGQAVIYALVFIYISKNTPLPNFKLRLVADKVNGKVKKRYEGSRDCPHIAYIANWIFKNRLIDKPEPKFEIVDDYTEKLIPLTTKEKDDIRLKMTDRFPYLITFTADGKSKLGNVAWNTRKEIGKLFDAEREDATAENATLKANALDYGTMINS